MAAAEYWIWLQKTLGPASSLACKLIAYFGDPEKLYYAGRKEWLASGLMTEKQCDKLCRHSPSESFNVMIACLKYGLDIITPDCPFYPKLLLRIPDYPTVLYVQGNRSALRAPVMTAVVGTRKASQSGVRFTKELAYDLASAKVAVVSGGALGIDTAAHEGALDAGGVTIVVLGCGIGTQYLMQNEPMRRKAAEKGAVISEYPPETPPNKVSFPARNRILAGMSQATLVIEAAEKSGSFITAGDARNMNRIVFAVPASVSGSFYGGTDLLIREKKAYPANGSQDILRILQMQNGEWAQRFDEAVAPVPYGFPIPNYEEHLRRAEERKAQEAARQAALDAEKEEPLPAPEKHTKKEATAPKTVKKTEPKAAEKPAKKTAKKEKVQAEEAVSEQRTPPPELEGDELTVWKLLAEGERSPQEITDRTGLPAHKVMVAISKLEFKKLAGRDFGRVFLK